MLHPDTYVKETEKGNSVFAKREFKKGEILWIADDFDGNISIEHYKSLDAFSKLKVNRYCYLDSKHRVIIPWDEGKYVNHSCNPNSAGINNYDSVSIAVRDIYKDEEIQEDYYAYYGHFESFDCKCGAKNCRKFIYDREDGEEENRLVESEIMPLIVTQNHILLQVVSTHNEEFKKKLQEYI
ncbi:MAG: SET domain-containing protein-lysine N-methyltransferase [Bacteroidota bacterium]|nr:SET domain-containing protein-lysine N-methyltransferase [Bacteroidota bacterium]